MAYGPIVSVRTLNGTGFPAQQRTPEKSAQTCKQGVPLVLNGGYLQECAFGGPEIVYGVSTEPAHNLSVDGTGTSGTSEGTPPNQPSAVQVPVGAWMKDGNLGNYLANGDNVFLVSLKSGQTFSQALVLAGTYYGLTKDGTTGFWYLDTADTAGDNAVAELVGGVSDDNTKALFMFKSALRYFQ